MTTGVSRVECDRGTGTCRVQALIQPGSMKQPEGQGHALETPAGREAPRQRGPLPSGLY